MRSFFGKMNPTLRGLLIVALIALVVVVLQLQQTVALVYALVSIAFILAIVFFVYLVWRENRADIATWPLRARVVFYGAALLVVADLGAAWWGGARGMNLIAFLAVLGLSGFAMWRTWRDQHTYGI